MSVTEDFQNPARPAILAPAGNKAAFLAAIAAGANGIYVGLQEFSARMEAKNFTAKQLTALTRLARREGTKVYVALNAMLRPNDIDSAERALRSLAAQVRPHGIIVQDLAFIELARRVGFSGEIHLSTLANVSFGAALKLIKQALNVDGVVLPRELTIDELKTLAGVCPESLSLEVFVHGALCYGVSGRCYWSSFLGGRSGLRGRCVQPCRRYYTHKGRKRRFFSCHDLSLDVLVKVLLSIQEIRTWKIEGRKKGPHYVYHTVKAYRMLRDAGGNPSAKKEALGLLMLALGRPGTHYNFLPQRPQNPVKADVHTGSGLLLGKTSGTKNRPYVRPLLEILSGDVLRVGYEDEPWHTTHRVTKVIPVRGRFDLGVSTGKTPPKGTAVFLVDRRMETLQERIEDLEEQLEALPVTKASCATPKNPNRRKQSKGRPIPNRLKVQELSVYRRQSATKGLKRGVGVWVPEKRNTDRREVPVPKIWWWLPPVIWPETETGVTDTVRWLLDQGATHFVLNAPWQMALFAGISGLTLWAGPFCNVANPLAVNRLAALGYSGAVVSPELEKGDVVNMPASSPLPLGVVISGNWPLCISRVRCQELAEEIPFMSPKKETGWVKQLDANYWVFPNWKLDLTSKKEMLKKAGYTLFVHLVEPLPQTIALKQRPGLWNWNQGLP